MQFKVPQNVQREDRIVGPLTLRQLIICGIGGSIVYAIYVSLAKSYIWVTWLPPVAIVSLITVAFAFVRPLDLTFSRWILLWIEFAVIPRQRFWIQASAETQPYVMSEATKSKIDKRAAAKAEEIVDKRKKLEELANILNTQKPK
jgi:hypothetical protein